MAKQYQTKEEALTAISHMSGVNFFRLKAFDLFRDDKDVAFAAADKRIMNIRYVSDRLKEDKEFNLELMSKPNGGNGFQFLSGIIRSDRNVVLNAMSTWGSSLSDVSRELRADPEIVMTAVKNTGFALDFAAPQFQKDPVYQKEAFKTYGWALRHASEKDRADMHFVLLAVKKHPAAIREASPDIQAIAGDADPAYMLEKAINAQALQEKLEKSLSEEKHVPTRSLKL